jgi:hypothetical protein
MLRLVWVTSHSPTQRIPVISVEVDDATLAGFHGRTGYTAMAQEVRNPQALLPAGPWRRVMSDRLNFVERRRLLHPVPGVKGAKVGLVLGQPYTPGRSRVHTWCK